MAKAVVGTFTCVKCAKPFEKPVWPCRKGRTPKFCSPECQGWRRKIPIEVRFWKKVDKRGPDECWPWTASLHRGYPRIRLGVGEKFIYATRFSWELVNGPIPEGLGALHRCDNPRCVNPNHLFLGTGQDNSDDMVQKGRSTKGDRRIDDLKREAILILLRLSIPQTHIAEVLEVSPKTVRAYRDVYSIRSVSSPGGDK